MIMGNLQLLKFYLFIASFFLAITCVHAQQTSIPKTDQYFDLALGIGENSQTTYSLSWNKNYGLFSSKKLRLGYGFRFSGLNGKKLNYITAPADLTGNDATIDSLFLGKANTMALNAMINIQYQFHPKFKVGFNIDALGIGFGGEKKANFISSENTGQFPQSVSASPTSFNVLLGGDNDIGQLKSEFYLAYAVSQKTWLRAGLDMTFSEYKTEQELSNENDRFRNKPVLFFVAVSYNPFK